MLIEIDPGGFRPLYEQVKTEIRRLAALGAVKPNEPLPSIRDLAADLVINPNTIARAYRELEQEGLIYTQKGRGSFLTARRAQDRDRALEAYVSKTLDEAIGEVRKFGLSAAEIRKRFDERLRRVEGRERTGGQDE